MTGRAIAVGVLAGAVGCSGGAASSSDGQDRNELTGTVPAAMQAARDMNERPPLRRLFTAAPETVARQTAADHAARVTAYLGSDGLPDAIPDAIRRHEIWLGMSRQEVFLSVGPPAGPAGAWTETSRTVSYADEGWHLKFDARGYLTELVER